MPPRNPSNTYVLEVKRHYETLWRPAHDEWSQVDTYIDRTYRVWNSAQNRNNNFLRPPGAAAIIDDFLDNLPVMGFQVHRNPTSRRRNAEKEKEMADAVENGLFAVMMEAALLEPVLSWKLMMWHLAAYGYTVIDAPRWTSRDKPEEPERDDYENDVEFEIAKRVFQNEKKTWMPLRIHVPHPARILLDPWDMRPPEGMKVETTLTSHIRAIIESRREQDLPVNNIDLSHDDFEHVEGIDYWNRNAHSLVVMEQTLFTDNNVEKLMPFKHAFAPWGHETTNTHAVKRSPETMARSVIEPVMDMIQAQAQQYSALHNASVFEGYNREYFQGDATDIREQIESGATMVELPQGQEAPKRADPPQIQPWMVQWAQQIDAEMQKGTFDRLAVGQAQPNQRTVGQMAIATTNVNKNFEAAMEIARRLITWVGQDTLRLVDANDEPLYARGYELRPEDINHDYAVWIDFPQKDPAFELARGQFALQEATAGYLDRESYWEQRGYEDTTKIKDGLVLDALMQSPIVQEILARTGAERAGLGNILGLSAQGLQGDTAGNQQGGLVGPNGQPIGSLAGQQGIQGQSGTPGQREGRQALNNEVTNPPRSL